MLTSLKPWASGGLLNVVVDTPKGSRNKFALDSESDLFILKKVLPLGMSFPYDFGFVPSTLAEDGDPLDALVLMDEPAFTGCLLRCRVVGIVEGVQGSGRKKARNDRLIAIEMNNQTFRRVRTVRDLGSGFLKELEAFFMNYHQLTGAMYRVVATHGPKAARERVEQAFAAASSGRRP
jgi:inorganic pyrophosphatase